MDKSTHILFGKEYTATPVQAKDMMAQFEFQDAYGQGYDVGFEGKPYNSPFPIGSNEDDEYEDGYGSGRLDFNKMNPDL